MSLGAEMPFLFLLLWAHLALGEQLTHSLDLSTGLYKVSWRVPGAQGTHHLQAALPSPSIHRPELLQATQDVQSLNQEAALQLREWGANEGVEIQAIGSRRGLKTQYWIPSGDNELQARVQAATEMATQTAREKQHLIRVDGGFTIDHAWFAVERAADVEGIALAFAGNLAGSEPRQKVQAMLGYVQNIPYRKGKKRSVTLPLGVVMANQGDCDSKSLLLLALLRTAMPTLKTAIVYIPHHALVALALPPLPSDRTLQEGGTTWVLAEAVGPRNSKVGEVAETTGHALRGGPVTLREVPALIRE